MIAPCFDDVKAGDHLPELTVPLTATLIVAGAIASRDYEGVHHDADAARHSGLPNVFMNILTTNGIVGRFVAELRIGVRPFGEEAQSLGAAHHLRLEPRPARSLTWQNR